MDIFRVAKSSDIDRIFAITSNAGVGLSTVPKTIEAVEKYVSSTENFMAGNHKENSVLFVLEVEGRVVGISGIIVQSDAICPFWSFEHKTIKPNRAGSAISPEHEILQLSSKFNGYTELGTLLLSPQALGKGYGKLLSLGRLAFINEHRSAFNEKLMADIRGWQDEQGVAPFWTGLSSRFINVSFDKAEFLLSRDKDFLPNAIPSDPIYLQLLDKQARACIGQANNNSMGAIKLLCSAGFSATNFCNVLDGGPALECPTLETVVAKTATVVRSFSSTVHTERTLQYSGTGYEFRAAIGHADIENGVLSEDTKVNFPDFHSSPIKLSKLSMPSQQNEVNVKQRVSS